MKNRERLQNLTKAIEQTQEAVLVTNKSGIIEFVNQSFEKLTGYRADEAIGRTPRFLKSGTYDDNFYKEMWQVILTGKTFRGELLNKKKNGDLYYDEKIISPIKNELGEITHFVSNSRDITKRKINDREIKLMAQFAELNPAPVLRFDCLGNILSANKAAIEVANLKTLVDENITAIFPQISLGAIRESIEQGKVIIVTEKVRNKYFQFTIKGISELKIGQAYGSDITDMMLIQEELAKAKSLAEQATKAKSRFLTTMSHEIRTPMNAVLGMTELLAASKLNKKQVGYLDVLSTSGNLLLATINDILDFSKFESGQLKLEEKPISLKELITNTIQILNPKALEKKNQLTFEISNDVPDFIRGDSVRIQQILINLIGNAVKFTKNGKISIDVKVATSQTDKLILQFTITDTGIGIAENKLESIFTPFKQAEDSTTRNFGGTGLGLAICSRLVTNMDGKIGVNSKLGQGSTFFFTIKTKVIKNRDNEGMSSSPVSNGKSEQKDKSRLKLLVAEDNILNQKLFSAMLDNLGYTADYAINGFGVLALLEKNKYDIIFMDVEMPKLDGIETTKEIILKYSAEKKPVIIATTANAIHDERENCLKAGMNDYLTKPISLAAIEAAILKWSSLADSSKLM